MNSLENKIKAWYGKMFAKTPSYDRRFLRPSRDWMIIFFTTLLCLIMCAVGAFYFYMQVDSGNYFNVTAPDTQSEVKINSILLEKMVSEIDTRAAAFDAAKVKNIAPADPSR